MMNLKIGFVVKRILNILLIVSIVVIPLIDINRPDKVMAEDDSNDIIVTNQTSSVYQDYSDSHSSNSKNDNEDVSISEGEMLIHTLVVQSTTIKVGLGY